MSDPLGLSADQRNHSDMRELAKEFLAQIRARAEYIDSLPDGATVPCDLPYCEIQHPVEMFR